MSIIRMLGISIFILVFANCGSRSVGTPVATPLPSATIKSGTDATAATDQVSHRPPPQHKSLL
jgi:hypothetical protein